MAQPRRRGQLFRRMMRRALLLLSRLCVTDAYNAKRKDKPLQVVPVTNRPALDFDDVLILAGAEGFPDKLR